jgi:hypothetical protein
MAIGRVQWGRVRMHWELRPHALGFFALRAGQNAGARCPASGRNAASLMPPICSPHHWPCHSLGSLATALKHLSACAVLPGPKRVRTPDAPASATASNNTHLLGPLLRAEMLNFEGLPAPAHEQLQLIHARSARHVRCNTDNASPACVVACEPAGSPLRANFCNRL